jgi:hypothetical protein
MTQKDRAARLIEVALGQRERLADPQPRAPNHHDQPPQPQTMHAIACDTHDQHDLLHTRRIGGIAHALVTRRLTAAVTRHRCYRPTATGSIQQHDRIHDPSQRR